MGTNTTLQHVNVAEGPGEPIGRGPRRERAWAPWSTSAVARAVSPATWATGSRHRALVGVCPIRRPSGFRRTTCALDNQWKKKDDPARKDHFTGLGEGDGFAKMYIPAFGADYHFTIVEGTSGPDLEIGPGHYQHTAYPGEPGNFAVAGHRVGKGAPFNDINLINSCDAIVVETQNNWFVYRALPKAEEKDGWAEGKGKEAQCKGVQVLGGPYKNVVGQAIVSPSDGLVVAPVPGDKTAPSPGEQASLMTLTTCHPRFSDKQRLIVHAVLVKQWQKDPAKPNWTPPELEET